MEKEQACYSISESMLFVCENVLFQKISALMFLILEVAILPQFRTKMHTSHEIIRSRIQTA